MKIMTTNFFKSNSVTTFKGLIFLTGLMTLLCLFWAIICHRGLYGDGVIWVHRVSTLDNIHLLLRPRASGIFLLTFIPVFFKWLGCESYRMLSWAYTFNSYLLPVLFWFWAIYLLRDEKNKAFIFLVGFLFIFFPNNMHLFNTSHIQISLNAVAAAYLLRNDRFNWASVMGLSLALLLCFRNYEATFIVAPFFVLLIFHRLFKENYNSGLKIGLFAVGLLALLLFLECFHRYLTVDWETKPEMTNFRWWFYTIFFYLFGFMMVYTVIRSYIIKNDDDSDSIRFLIGINNLPNYLAANRLIKYEIKWHYLMVGMLGMVAAIFIYIIWTHPHFLNRIFWPWQRPYYAGVLPRNLPYFIFWGLLLIFTLDRICFKNRIINSFQPNGCDYLMALGLCLIVFSNDIKSSTLNREFIRVFYRVVNENSGIFESLNSPIEAHTRESNISGYGIAFTYGHLSAVMSDKNDSAVVVYKSTYPTDSWLHLPFDFDQERSKHPEIIRFARNYYWRTPK